MEVAGNLRKGYKMIVRVHMNYVKHDLDRRDGFYKDVGIKTASNLDVLWERAQLLDHEGDIMTYVVPYVMETPRGYNIMFEGQAFKLSKRNLDDRWFRFNDCFEFRLCKTADDFWKAFRGYHNRLLEQVKKMQNVQPIGEWEPHGDTEPV